jgi:hypothetical protein
MTGRPVVESINRDFRNGSIASISKTSEIGPLKPT